MNKNILFVFLCINFLMIGQNNDLIQEGINQFHEENYESALITFKKALKTDTKNATALEYLGDIKFKQKKWGEAADYFKKALCTDKSNAVYHFKYGGALGMKAKQNKLKAIFILDDIKEHLQIAADLDTTYIDPRMVMVELYMELPKAFGGGIDKAREYADEVASIDKEKGKEADAIIKRLSKG